MGYTASISLIVRTDRTRSWHFGRKIDLQNYRAGVGDDLSYSS
jgi:hypothetical protein